MKQNRLFVALCAMMLTTGVMAQQRKKVNANGWTIDAKSRNPLTKVDVTIMTTDSTIVTTYPSWDLEGYEGRFSFNLEWGKSYIFQFTKEGYDTVYVNQTYPAKSMLMMSGIGNLGKVALKKTPVSDNLPIQIKNEEGEP